MLHFSWNENNNNNKNKSKFVCFVGENCVLKSTNVSMWKIHDVYLVLLYGLKKWSGLTWKRTLEWQLSWKTIMLVRRIYCFIQRFKFILQLFLLIYQQFFVCLLSYIMTSSTFKRSFLPFSNISHLPTVSMVFKNFCNINRKKENRIKVFGVEEILKSCKVLIANTWHSQDVAKLVQQKQTRKHV